jgi:excisionase family DNA binding protein
MDSLLTPKQVAELLGVQLSTIYQWTHEEFIPHVKLRRLVRFKISDILAWLEKQKKKGRSNRRIDID